MKSILISAFVLCSAIFSSLSVAGHSHCDIWASDYGGCECTDEGTHFACDYVHCVIVFGLPLCHDGTECFGGTAGNPIKCP